MASGFHQTIIMGNVGKEPELKYSANGTAICQFSVAVNDTYVKDGERHDSVTWYNVVMFGRQGEVAGQYLEKGKPIMLEGKMNFRSYETKEGQKRYISELVVRPGGMTFVAGGRRDDDGSLDEEAFDDIPFEG
jgi:single-strand DNA-binding protein